MRFNDVPAGVHVVTEDIPPSRIQTSVTPQAPPREPATAWRRRRGRARPPSGFSLPRSPPPSPPPSTGTRHYEDVVRTSTQNVFTDLNASTLEGQAAAYLFARGVVGGYSDNTFRAYANVNRAEAAKFVLLAAGYQIDPSARNNGQFWDVLEGEWYVRYVITAARVGVITGPPDGSFRPADGVPTAELLAMLDRAFDLGDYLPHSYVDVSANDWFAPYAGIAARYELFPSRSPTRLEPNRPLTRGEVAVALHRVLTRR